MEPFELLLVRGAVHKQDRSERRVIGVGDESGGKGENAAESFFAFNLLLDALRII